ncbi:hypothetical protein AAF712_015730 [Marasmius tenuissimus]|uniref:Uncharacterized protein n=1 Tax=Marasmius tenuissimus TaxID=585030 RepID=A0ABR2Z8R0_9AGAR
MTAGGHWDTMDDLANFWNYRKTINLKDTLMEKIVKAIPEAIVTARCYVAFTEALKDDHLKELLLWLDQVTKWEQGKSNFCPYNVEESKLGLNQVKKQLADEEHQQEVDGLNPSSTVMVSVLIIKALKIEEVQHVLVIAAAAERNLTPLQQ